MMFRMPKEQRKLSFLSYLVVEATGVPPMDYSGSSDPYIRVKFGTKVYRTPIIKRNMNPKWNHQFRILLYREQLEYLFSSPILIELISSYISYDMTLQLYDWDKVSANDFISSVKFSLTPITSSDTLDFQAFEIPVRSIRFESFSNVLLVRSKTQETKAADWKDCLWSYMLYLSIY